MKSIYIPHMLWDKIIYKKQNIDLLQIISESGHYKNRKHIAQKIESFSKENKLKLIQILLNDKIDIISKFVINESTKMSLPKALQIEINKRTEYWKKNEIENEQKRIKMKNSLKNRTNRKRKFSNGETYQNMKEMIKKTYEYWKMDVKVL